MLLWTMQGLLVASATDHSRVRCVRARPEIVYVCCVSVCVCVCVCVCTLVTAQTGESCRCHDPACCYTFAM